MSVENKRNPEKLSPRHRRIVLAREFLEEEIIPRMAKGEQLNSKCFKTLMSRFQRKYKGRGKVFDLAHVYVVAIEAVAQAREEHGFGSYEASLTEGAHRVLTRLLDEELAITKEKKD